MYLHKVTYATSEHALASALLALMLNIPVSRILRIPIMEYITQNH